MASSQISYLASCSVPVNYDYTRLNVETRTLAVEGQGEDTVSEDSNRPTSYSNSSTSLRYFWDGGLLANTPLSADMYCSHRLLA